MPLALVANNQAHSNTVPQSRSGGPFYLHGVSSDQQLLTHQLDANVSAWGHLHLAKSSLSAG